MRENWADLIEKALRTVFPESDSVEICYAYGAKQGSRGLLDGLEDVKERRARGDLMRPVLIYGLDPEERIRQHESGSILDAPGVFYVRLPALLSDIESIIQKAARAEIPAHQAIDEKSFRDYAVKRIRAFKHRLDNVCASMEMNANRARKELERSPGIMPRAMLEFKPSNLDKLLSEYSEVENACLRLGIPHADEITGMIKRVTKEMRQIEQRRIESSEAVTLALSCVMTLRRISDELARSTVLYNHRNEPVDPV